VYHLAPHGKIREDLFGKDQPRELSRPQLDMFKARIAEEMEKGAAGMSTGLFYFPGFLAQTKEIIELCKVVAKYGGLYASHVRDESGKRMPGGGFGDFNSIKEAIEIGERAGVPVEISHLKLHAPFDGSRVEQVLDLIEAARHRGVEVHADQYPYDAWSCPITDELPDEFRVSGAVKEQYKTKEGRMLLEKAAENVFRNLPPDKIFVSMFQEDEKLEGKNLAQIAEAEGISPAEVFVRLACAKKPPLDVAFAMRDDDVKKIMARDFVITASDGWTVPKDLTRPHPRCYGTFPRKIRKYVLDGKILGLSAAIHSMTSLPAEKFRIKDRGKIAKGCFADIAVIDVEKITDRATYMDPHRYPAGIEYVMVNGVLSVAGGNATGDRAGACLLRA
jgi:N-acyl-D-amino-acid deacylase